jgi:hypothetical protein
VKISFPKYCPGELLTRKQGAARIISFVAIVFFSGVCGTYVLGNRFWLLTIAVLCIAGVLVFLGVGVAVFLKQSKVDEAPSAPVEENKPCLVPQWDYRPSKPIRVRGTLDSPGAETFDGLGSDPFGTNDNVWLNDNLLEGVTPAFINAPPEAEERITKALPQPTDSVDTAPTADEAAVSRYD